MATFEDIKGFTFDLDGVITDTAKFHDKAWHNLADFLGVQWNEDLGERLKGISRMDSLEMILEEGGKQADYTPAEKEEFAAKKNANYVELIQGLTPADILPGIKEFLDEAKAGGYEMSIASASKNAPTILEKLGIIDYFKGIVDPATLSKGKPDPEIFAKAGEILGLKPEQIVGFEDASAGVLSIKGAGQTAAGIGSAAKTENPEIYFENTAEVTLANIKKQMD